MRYSVFLFLFFVFGLTVGHSKDVLAYASESTQNANRGLLQQILDKLNEVEDGQIEQTELDGKAAEENTVGRAAQTGQLGQVSDANNAVAVQRAHQVADVETHRRTMNLDAYACSYVTSTGSIAGAAEAAAAAIKENNTARMRAIAGEAGTATENGLVDFQNQLFTTMQSFGPDRFNIGQLFTEPNIQADGADAAQLEYLQDLLYARVPVYLNKRLLDNADTETKSLSVQTDRLRSEMAIGQTVFSILLGNRKPSEDGYNSTEFLREIMSANGYSDDKLDVLLPESGASLRAQLEGLSMGQFGPGYSMEKLVENPEVTGAGILFNSMLTNVLLFKQYELLETIAASTSTQVIATREEAIKDVNARTSRKNAR